MKITFPGKKMQTMADRFQEALGTSSVIAEGTHVAVHNSLRYEVVVSSYFHTIRKSEFELILNSVHGCPAKLYRDGIFGKLQHVIQKEKERDIDFLKKLQTGGRPDSKTFTFTLPFPLLSK